MFCEIYFGFTNFEKHQNTNYTGNYAITTSDLHMQVGFVPPPREPRFFGCCDVMIFMYFFLFLELLFAVWALLIAMDGGFWLSWVDCAVGFVNSIAVTGAISQRTPSSALCVMVLLTGNLLVTTAKAFFILFFMDVYVDQVASDLSDEEKEQFKAATYWMTIFYTLSSLAYDAYGIYAFRKIKEWWGNRIMHK